MSFKSKKILIIALAVLVAICRIALIYSQPIQGGAAQITDQQLTYVALLADPILQVLVFLSLAIMSLELSWLYPKQFKRIAQPVSIIFAVVALVLLAMHWSYVFSEFMPIMSAVIYHAFNPNSSPDMGYYAWRYSLNPSKVFMAAIILPLIMPVFCHLLQRIRDLRK